MSSPMIYSDTQTRTEASNEELLEGMTGYDVRRSRVSKGIPIFNEKADKVAPPLWRMGTRGQTPRVVHR